MKKPRQKIKGLSERVDLVFRSANMTQREFAAKMGSSQSYLGYILRGASPGAEFLFKLRQASGVSLDWLLMGTGSMFGGGVIQLETFKVLATQAALVHAAIVNGDSAAAKALDLCLKGGALRQQAAVLSAYMEQCQQMLTVASIYNRYLDVTDARERINFGLIASAEHYRHTTPKGT